MKMIVCSVHDAAVGAYMQPFFSRSKPEAIRSFADAVGNGDSPFAKHKADFTLMVIGSFDDMTGEISYRATGPEKLLSALEVVPLTGA
ncbi:MAG: nonstructural protein [Microvirus sp.]|nr:MAG: nonstructural protein [Microvirus sp.]